MNCQDISKLIYVYCDGEVSPEDYTDISEHLDNCANCQYMYQLTIIENDVLRDKADIPALSPAFTSLVMSSLQSDNIPNNKSRFSRFNRKVWLSGLTTVAAVVALFLYLPHQSFIDNNISSYYSASIQEPSSASPSVAYDTLIIAGQSNLSDSDKTAAPKAATPEAPPNVVKNAPLPDNNLNQPMTMSVPEASGDTKQSAAMDLSKSIFYDRVAESTNITLRPQNIPDRLKFVQVTNGENKTVFDYASLDGTEYLQLSLVPYSESTLGAKTETDPLPQDPLPLSKDLQIADKKMTVFLSGNLPMAEMNVLANTIQFSDPSSN